MKEIVSGSAFSVLRSAFFDDEIVGMINEFAHFGVGEFAFKDDGVPVSLIHVITGFDARISFAQFECARRIAFEIDGERQAFERDEREDFI